MQSIIFTEIGKMWSDLFVLMGVQPQTLFIIMCIITGIIIVGNVIGFVLFSPNPLGRLFWRLSEKTRITIFYITFIVIHSILFGLITAIFFVCFLRLIFYLSNIMTKCKYPNIIKRPS